MADGQVANITDCIEIELEAGAGKKDVDYDAPRVQELKRILKRIYLTLFPIPVDNGWCDCGMIHGEEPVVE